MKFKLRMKTFLALLILAAMMKCNTIPKYKHPRKNVVHDVIDEEESFKQILDETSIIDYYTVVGSEKIDVSFI